VLGGWTFNKNSTVMSELPPPPPAPPIGSPPSGSTSPSGLSLLAKLLLFAVLPIVVALALVAVVLSTLFTRGSDVTANERVEARSEVVVDVDNAEVRLLPSADDDVHVRMTGYQWGHDPQLVAGTSGDSTIIEGGCRGGWFGICRITLTVSLPAELPLVVDSTNGAITVEDLAGPLSLSTNNGAVRVSDSSGEIEASTSNGAVTVEDSASPRVAASTSNGRIELRFDEAPVTVDARTSNGGVSIGVPVDGYEYRVDVETVNGSVDDSAVPVDNDSNRSIFVRTSNGSVTVEPSDG
jgi:hypothetical protein